MLDDAAIDNLAEAQVIFALASQPEQQLIVDNAKSMAKRPQSGWSARSA